MSDVREMRIFSAEQIQVPTDLPTILKEFSKAVIRNGQSDDLVKFCREYFEEKAAQHAKVNKNMAAAGLDFEELGRQAAAQAMAQFDENNDGKLSKAEAEPMFRGAFEQLIQMGKISSDFQWSQAIFN